MLLIYLLLALGFVIYIPVALFRSNAFLLLQDGLLLLAFCCTLATPLRQKRLLGGDLLTIFAVCVFLLSLVPGAILDPWGMSLSTVQGLRSLLFGILVLILSSIWLDTPRRVDRVLQIMVIGSVFTALYGIRQLAFGLLPFELERMAMMGNTVDEIENLNRLRIPSAFGDPATFSFTMLLGAVLYLAARQRSVLPSLTRLGHPWTLFLLIFGLGITLTRAPMLGLAAALAVLYLVQHRWKLKRVLRFIGALMITLIVLLGINQIMVDGVFADSDADWAHTVNSVLTAVWTLLPRFMSGEVSAELETLRSLSTSYRSAAWGEGLTFLSTHPFGGGIGTITEGGRDLLTLSPIDVGVLRYGLETGWFGLLGVAGILGGIALAGLRKIRRLLDRGTRTLGIHLLALWIGIGVAVGVTSFLHTEALSAMVWTLGGIMLNLDRVSNRSTEVYSWNKTGVAR